MRFHALVALITGMGLAAGCAEPSRPPPPPTGIDASIPGPDGSLPPVGDGGVPNDGAPLPADPPAEVVAGTWHTCLRTAAGVARCWGNNQDGELGIDSSDIIARVPVAVVGVTTAAGVSAKLCSCANLVDGRAQCWGANDRGQLGTGMEGTGSPAPVDVPGLDDVVQIVAGSWHVCARTTSAVYCWGYNEWGQIGDGTAVTAPSPTAVTSLGFVDGISVGDGHSCALANDGTVSCWGRNVEGQLGSDTGGEDRTTPVPTDPLAGTATALSAGSLHTCVLLGDGTVQCWGHNGYGQLGDGTTESRTQPMSVPGLSSIVEISAGAEHTCARRDDGTLLCWGHNDAGQLGDGTTADRHDPTEVFRLSGTVQVTAGGGHTCARMATGILYCWGYNIDGQIGDGSLEDRALPALVQLPW